MLVFRSLAFLAVLFLAPAGQDPPNPWRFKAPPIIAKAEKGPTPELLSEAFDAAWKADDWEAGVRLARIARERFTENKSLYSRTVRALWRGGAIADAEELAERRAKNVEDEVLLEQRIVMQLARGELPAARRTAEKLARVKDPGVEALLTLLAVRMAEQDLLGCKELIRTLQKTVDPKLGYPNTFAAESLEGLAEFMEAAGRERLNQVAAFGAAPMPPIESMGLPYVDALINGKGPYRLLLDTGGSIALSIDNEVAEDLGLKSIADASIRGATGKDTSGQAIVSELRVGDIVSRRVITRIFGVREAVAGIVDGILGTGIYSDARMTLDFAGERIVIAPPSDRPGPGRPMETRIIGDAKILSLITIQGQAGVALLDTGASAVAVSPRRMEQWFDESSLLKVENVGGIGVGSGEGMSASLSPPLNFELAGRKSGQFNGLGLDVLDRTLSPILGTHIDLLVGMPVFREMKRMTVDYPSCRVWIEWSE